MLTAKDVDLHQTVTISNPLDDSLTKEVVARVDPSERYTLVPADLAEKVGLRVNSHGLAMGTIALHGREEMSPMRITHWLRELIIGEITLQSLALTIDESTGELKESEYFLYAAQEARS